VIWSLQLSRWCSKELPIFRQHPSSGQLPTVCVPANSEAPLEYGTAKSFRRHRHKILIRRFLFQRFCRLTCFAIGPAYRSNSRECCSVSQATRAAAISSESGWSSPFGPRCYCCCFRPRILQSQMELSGLPSAESAIAKLAVVANYMKRTDPACSFSTKSVLATKYFKRLTHCFGSCYGPHSLH